VELTGEIVVGAPAHAVWAELGERFGHIGEWAAPIAASSLDGEPRVGAVRTCHTARFGPVAPGVITERLTAFDPAAMAFAYEAVGGMPGFVRRASNRWSVHPQGERRCLVRTHATLELRGPAVLLSFFLKWRLHTGGARVLDELRYRIEHGRPHPRKRRTPVRNAPGP
jgi:hypothetical protein